MTVLLVDAGNTRIKCSLIEPHDKLASRSRAFNLEDIGEIAGWLSSLDSPPHKALGINVAGPQVEQQISSQVGAYCPIEWLHSQKQTLHLSNGYAEPERLGVDRWIAMLGVSYHYPTDAEPVVLASFGTATTVDVIYQNKFLGGVIAPGLDLMSLGLSTKTAQLPHLKWAEFKLVDTFATDTETAIRTGILTAQSGVVLGQWYRAHRQFSAVPRIIVSGGASDYVLPQLKSALGRSVEQLGFEEIPLEGFEDPALEGLRLVANSRET